MKISLNVPHTKHLIKHLMTSVVLFAGMTLSWAGTIKGRVVFDGTPPPPEKVEVRSDSAVCGSHQQVPKVIVGEGGGIRFAVVKLLTDNKTQFPKVKPADGALDQIQCQFEPHVQIVPAGSKLVITSSDAVLHNAHGFDEGNKTVFNIAVPIKGMKVPVELKKPGRIKLRCDAGHSWMRGHVIVSEHPYHVVTDTNGAFELKDVPAGTYNLEVWQETFGVQHQQVIVSADGISEVKFAFSNQSMPKAAK